jgi:hypothetical protein
MRRKGRRKKRENLLKFHELIMTISVPSKLRHKIWDFQRRLIFQICRNLLPSKPPLRHKLFFVAGANECFRLNVMVSNTSKAAREMI